MTLFKNRVILFPTDFSECAANALELAASLARDQQARLVIQHVVPFPQIYGEVMERRDEEFWENARRLLNGVQSPVPGVVVEHRLDEGDAAETIAEAARQIGADLIVMGTHGRTGLGRLLLGSVAEQVLRKAPCPVLTVKPATAAKSPPPDAGLPSELLTQTAH